MSGKWPDGPRFVVRETRGYYFALGVHAPARSSNATPQSDFLVLDRAYNAQLVRMITQASGRTRHEALGLALYICAALNADPFNYVARLMPQGITRRARRGWAPSYQDPREAGRRRMAEFSL